MPIWPKRLAQRVVAIAAESCTEPIMNARRVEFRNGINAIAFVAMKMIAGATTNPGVVTFPGEEGLCGSDRGVGLSDDAWPKARTGPARGITESCG